MTISSSRLLAVYLRISSTRSSSSTSSTSYCRPSSPSQSAVMTPFWQRPPPTINIDNSSPPPLRRRLSRRVSSLVAKFEALATSRSDGRESEPPAPRSIESVVTTTASISRDKVTRKGLGRKASKLFHGLVDGAQDSAKHERDDPSRRNEEPPKNKPPARKLLTESFAQRKLKMRPGLDSITAKMSKLRGAKSISWLEPGGQTSASQEADGDGGGVDHRASVEFLGVHHLSAIDGSQDPSGGTSPGTVSPPVAKVLPSSFFAQLIRGGDADRPVNRSILPKVLQDRDDEDLVAAREEKIDIRKFRINSFGRRGESPVWKRKITPPRVSVKDLISRFRQPESSPNVETGEASTAVTEGAADQFLSPGAADPASAYTSPRLNAAAESSINDSATPGLPGDELPRAPVPTPAINLQTSDDEHPSLPTPQPATTSTSVSSSLGSSVASAASSIRGIFSSRRRNTASIPIANGTPGGDQQKSSVSTKAKLRPPSAAQKVAPKKTVSPDSKPVKKRKSFYSKPSSTATAIARTPKLPRQASIVAKKSFRKTPPPALFFVKKPKQKISPEIPREITSTPRPTSSPAPPRPSSRPSLRNISPGKKLKARTTPRPIKPKLNTRAIAAVAAASGAAPIPISLTSPVSSTISNDSITIWVGTPALTIVSPIPVNMVATYAIRDFVHRFL
ncbi:hypothetical protein EX30DRAFT_344921 [Ascodesmis nigricans]|uniref:Uncharacterized protein n=1 Tax=Ascodesmis nigricans TaxID=341454 RepID=A0A4S2MHR2_9PEZI|nr:hypothetical protein EX30DRAFT_344921 [Ascodesmis nigricans]